MKLISKLSKWVWSYLQWCITEGSRIVLTIIDSNYCLIRSSSLSLCAPCVYVTFRHWCRLMTVWQSRKWLKTAWPSTLERRSNWCDWRRLGTFHWCVLRGWPQTSPFREIFDFNVVLLTPVVNRVMRRVPQCVTTWTAWWSAGWWKAEQPRVAAFWGKETRSWRSMAFLFGGNISTKSMTCWYVDTVLFLERFFARFWSHPTQHLWHKDDALLI